MDIHGVLQFLFQGLTSCSFSQQLTLYVVQLSSAQAYMDGTILHTYIAEIVLPEVIHVGHTLGEGGSLSPHLLHFQLEDTDVFQPLCILNLSYVQSRLLDLDLLIEQCQLIVATDHLSTKNVTFIDHL